MKFLPVAAVALLCVVPDVCAKPSPLRLEPGRTYLRDDFKRKDLQDEWKVGLGTAEVVDGEVVCGELEKDNHSGILWTEVEFEDLVMSFDFTFEGADNFNLVFGDSNYDGSHAGHIVRVQVFPDRVSIEDNKEGFYKKEIFSRKNDREFMDSVQDELEEKQVREDARIRDGKTYSITVMIKGEQLTVMLGKKHVASLISPGIAHETKNRISLMTKGQFVKYDNFRISKPRR